MKKIMLIAMLVSLVSFGLAQTVTVSKSGTPDYNTVQAAIDYFATDPAPTVPNVINITDSSVYDEMITINVPVTIEGTDANRPVLAIQTNTGGDANDGLLILIPTGTANVVVLKNLIIIPSKTNTPQDDGIRSHGQNVNLTLENVLVTANNGSDAPITTTGLEAVDLTGAIMFGDDGIFIGGTTTPAGDGFSATLKDVVVSHIQGAAGGVVANDGLVLSGAGNVFRILDGCVFSYCNRLGIQATGDFQINAPNKRVVVLGNKGFAGIWFAAAPTNAANPRLIDGCNVINNLGENHTTAPVGAWGIEIQNGGTVNTIVKNSIIAGNSDRGIVIGELTGTGTVSIENVTIANNGAAAINDVAGYTADINITDTIIAGNGSAKASNVIVHNGSGVMNIAYSGIVTAGPQSLLIPATTGTGPFITSNIVESDPQFVDAADYRNDSFFDVFNDDYYGANSLGAPLSGGADYVGPIPTPTPVPLSADKIWKLYA